MPILARPGNDTSRIATLDQVVISHCADAKNKQSYLSGETVDAVNSILPPYRTAYQSIATIGAGRSRETAEKNSSLGSLETYVRHFWGALKNRVDRENLPTSLLTLYGLPLSGILPKTYADRSLIETASQLIAADAQAYSQGFLPMANPSAAELKKCMDSALKEMNDCATIDNSMNAQEGVLAVHRGKAEELITEVVDELRFALRKLPEPDQRRIMRGYGLSFTGETGEVVVDPVPAK